MYKTSTNRIIEIFNEINALTHNELIELSVKKSRINFEFKEPSLIHLRDIIQLLDDALIQIDYLYLTALEGHLHLTYDCSDAIQHNMVPKSSLFKDLFDLLQEIGEHICQCPALEYLISKDYIKIFIDKPNIESTDLQNLEEVFGTRFTLELHKQRPYCLFLNNIDTNQTTLDEEILNPEYEYLTSDMVRKI